MAVIAVWLCDRDGSMFEDKKVAEEHDKYLELAAKYSEAIGILLAQRRELLAKACKGKPDELLQPFTYEKPVTLNSKTAAATDKDD